MSLNEVLIEKEATIEQLQEQVNNLLKDIENSTESYATLQVINVIVSFSDFNFMILSFLISYNR
jgi:hypothetical protein